MIFDCLFGLYVFSHQSCATGTLLIPKDIHPRKYCQIFTNLFFNAYLVIMSPLEKVPFATFYPLQKYLRGTCFFKNDFFKWTQSLKNNLNILYIFMVYISFLISHVPPAHSFFQKKYILINLTQNLVQLIF